MRAFRTDAHLLQCQTDLPADILPPVLRSNIHISCFIVGDLCRLVLFIKLKQIEFLFRAEGKGISCPPRIFHRPFEQTAGIAFEGCTVRIGYAGEHPNDFSMLRTPRKDHQRVRIRVKQKIALCFIAKACDGGCIECNTIFKGARQLLRHD